MKRFLIAIFVAGFIAGFFVPAPTALRAHGAFDWIMNDPNPAISSCCGPADCEHVKTGDIEATGAGWYLKETGEVIPFDKTFPSKDGQVARCRFLATGKTRCLFIPPGGS